jgi:acyl-CoA hydrolase
MDGAGPSALSRMAKPSTLTRPQGEIVIRTIAMPADTKPSGEIFGGWHVSQMAN